MKRETERLKTRERGSAWWEVPRHATFWCKLMTGGATRENTVVIAHRQLYQVYTNNISVAYVWEIWKFC